MLHCSVPYSLSQNEVQVLSRCSDSRCSALPVSLGRTESLLLVYPVNQCCLFLSFFSKNYTERDSYSALPAYYISKGIQAWHAMYSLLDLIYAMCMSTLPTSICCELNHRYCKINSLHLNFTQIHPVAYAFFMVHVHEIKHTHLKDGKYKKNLSSEAPPCAVLVYSCTTHKNMNKKV